MHGLFRVLAWPQSFRTVVRSMLPFQPFTYARSGAQAPEVRASITHVAANGRSDAENAQAGLLQATLAGLERLVRVNTEALHGDPMKFCAVADLVRELGLLARMQSARTDLVLLTLQERIRLEPLQGHQHSMRLEVSGTAATSLPCPLAHFVVVDTLCQAVARWPASERSVIRLSIQNGQARYSCTLMELDGDAQQRLDLSLANLHLALMPYKRDLRTTPVPEPGGNHELSILIGA